MNIENRLDKKELTFHKDVDTVRLMEELYEAIPELAPVIDDGNIIKVNMRVFTSSNRLTLLVSNDLSEEDIRIVVKSHIAFEDLKEGDE